jgi:type II secretory pathway component PulM
MNAEAVRAAKERKQKVMLAVIFVLMVVAALYQFALVPGLSRWSQLKAELQQMQSELHMAQSVVNRSDEISRAAAGARSTLAQAAATRLPGVENPLSWASRIIYEHARGNGLEVVSITEVPPDRSLWMQKSVTNLYFMPYTVRVAMEGGYNSLQRMVETMEQRGPEMAVVGMTIGVQSDNPTNHLIGLTVQWPLWRDWARARRALELEAPR